MIDKKRRQLTTLLGVSTVVIPVSTLLCALPSYADEVPMVDETAPAAKNWKYAAISDNAEKSCSNCALYQGELDSVAGPCPLFPHMFVSANGLCDAYSPSPS